MITQELTGKSILVAEDDAATRRALVTLLGAAGYKVTAAADGREALEALRRQTPDLILLDLVMPVLDGWQFLQEQRQDPALASIPVVVVSGAALSEEHSSLGVGGLLHKPVQFDRLLDTVRGLVTRQRPGVLVVDDETHVRQLLKIALAHFGFTVWVASEGREGIELYRAHQQDIALVLLDVRMPDLDGPQTLAALRQLDPQVRCCFLTGDPGRYTAQELLDAGADRVFAKPFGLAEFTQALRQLLRTP